MKFNIGDRVFSPSFGAGIVQRPKFLMPNHHLVLFDDGRQFWILREILQPGLAVQINIPKQQRQRRQAS